ncbi:MAG: phosphonate ABC transporter ATP-binding protein [Bdellovibrionales bacterium]|nr:phosphonate ABC transporter ATP-binding protein [Bdellovibrionales bacterium]
MALKQNELTEYEQSTMSSVADSPLQVFELEKRFGDQRVLQGLTLSLKAGEATALLGSNGSGKSTLLRTIPKLISPDAGSVSVLGKDVLSLKSRDLKNLRSQIGFVFQKHNLVPRLNALTNTLHGALGRTSFGRAWFHSIAPKELREQAYSCLERVDLAAHAAKQTRHLSGGQSQRVAIARALMQQPKIMLADEPVASLDPEAGEHIMQLLRSLSEHEGITLLFSTHHLEHALQYADRIVGLVKGKIVLDKPSAELDIQSLREFYGE